MKYNKQIIFCVETRHSKTDKVYIMETIDHFFGRPRDIHLETICMESKTKYNSEDVKKKIEEKKAASIITTVIYCIDTDNWDKSAADQKKLEEIKNYCEIKGYEFVFFCKDIEDVYWGKHIHKKEKVNAAVRFRNCKVIQSIKEECLATDIYRKHCSNLLNILRKHMKKGKKK